MKAIIKKYLMPKGKPSWDSPLTGMVMKALDPFDYVVRSSAGLRHLPPYSIRVRSNGTSNQFGGKRFHSEGKLLFSLIRKETGLREDSSVLEIGCGCGRTALVMADYLTEGRYVGMDIEKVSLEAARNNKKFGSNFTFEHLDIENSLYNPGGQYEASTYRFPYKDQDFDLIFHFSVFTHMRTRDVMNYAKEAGRLLRPGGYCFFSMFIVGSEKEKMRLDKYSDEGFYYRDEDMPEAAIGYKLDFMTELFEKNGLFLKGAPLKDTGFAQDIVVFEKKA